MTAREIQLLQYTYALVEVQSDIFALRFYQRLFSIDPPLRALFQADIEQQAGKLMLTLKFAVESLDDLESLLPALQALGRRHVHYGVQSGHYAVVGRALLWTLEHTLGPAWTTEVASAWQSLYGFLSGVMSENAGATNAPHGPAVPEQDIAGIGESVAARPTK